MSGSDSSSDPRADPLDPDRATQEAWLSVFSKLALDHVATYPTAPASGASGAKAASIADQHRVPIPEEPLDGGAERVAEILGAVLPASLNTAGPGYLAYVPGGGLYASAVADFVSNLYNRFTGLSAAALGPCRLEADVLAWLASEFGYGPQARGLLTTGGSLANFSAIVTARHEHFGDTGDLRKATAYTSTQVHHSVSKSLHLAGIPRANLRGVSVDSRWRMDPADLARRITEDRAAGFSPFLVVASAGTTNTGAVDPLDELADICEREKIWLHADGAYGGAFVLCPEGREVLRGIERTDSVVFDPHKGMFLPYGTGCLLVRDGEGLRRAHSSQADYLQDFDELDRSREPPNPTDYGPELSRDYRGLRLWLPLMLHGAKAFRDALSEKLALTRRFHDGLSKLIDEGAPLEVVAAPQLSTVAFRIRREAGESVSEYNARNARLMAGINARDNVYLSSTNLPLSDDASADSTSDEGGAAFTLRVCILSFRTHQMHVNTCLDDIVQALASLEAGAV